MHVKTRTKPRPRQGRTLLLLVDQAVSSISNFAAAFLAVRAAEGSEFALTGVSLVVVRLVIGVTRSWSAEASLTLGKNDPNTAVEIGSAARSALPCALALSLVGLAALAIGGFLTTESALFVICAGVSMSVGEAARSAALLCRRVGPALGYDLLWLVVLAALLLTVEADSSLGVLTIWTAASVVALAVFTPYIRLRRDPTARPPTLRQRIGIAGDAFVDRGGSQIAVLALAFGLPAHLSAGFTAARNLLAPLNPLAIALFNLGFPASRATDAKGRGRLLTRNVLVTSIGVSILCLLITLMPAEWMSSAVGPTWDKALQFVIPVSISYLAMLAIQVASSVGRGARFSSELRPSRMLASALALVPCALVFADFLDDVVVVYAVSLVSLIGAAQFVGVSWHHVTSKNGS